MSLKLEIEQFQKGFMLQVPKEVLDQMLAASERLIASGLGYRSLKQGDIAPVFALSNAGGNLITSSDLLSVRWRSDLIV